MIAVLASIVLGQCVGGYCPAPTPSAGAIRRVSYQGPEYGWHEITYNGVTFSAWGYLVTAVDGKPRVRWDRESATNIKAYWDAANAKAEKPKAEPAKAIPNYGLVPDKIVGDGYTRNGQRVEPARARGAGLADRPQVTVIGTKAEREQVERDWASDPALKEFKDNTWFKGFDATDWQVSPEHGFLGNGHPTVIVQTADGGVIGRSDSYAGPKPLVIALRKAHSGYDPKADPPLAGNVAASLGMLPVAGGGIVLLVLMALPRRKA